MSRWWAGSAGWEAGSCQSALPIGWQAQGRPTAGCASGRLQPVGGGADRRISKDNAAVTAQRLQATVRHAKAGAGNREGAEQAPTNDEVHSRRCRVRRQQRVLVKSNVREGCIRAGQSRVKQREQGRGGEMQSLLAGSHHENHPLPAQVAVHARHCCSCLSLCLPPVGCCMLLPGWVSAHR